VTTAPLSARYQTVAPAPPRRSAGARSAWTLVGLFLAAAVVIAGALSAVSNVAYQKIPARQRSFTASVTAVSIDVGSGSVTVERSSGTRTLVRTWGSSGLRTPTDKERVSGGSLVIRSDCPSVLGNDNNCNRNYVVRVRPAASVTIDTGQGNVVVTAIAGPVSLHTGQGDVSVTDEVGALRATTGQGNVSVAGLRARRVTVASGEGDVHVGLTTAPTRVAASSSQGNVTVELPRGSASYRVHASSGQGTVSNTVASSGVSRRTIQATSSQGDVTVGYAPR
jgi:hypothetical protein